MDASFYCEKEFSCLQKKFILGLHQKSFGDSIVFVNKKERALIA